ncbi:MAG: hypothetical protein A2381_18655 [Bdellovibrionales bacterium RIFOXYB1_FULL_37_110]|nr:MAG: hypothetical protein A2417_01115 [Bdellovibrionales bacterium RIFOXYC1_FULL_37_79]OFZ59051.1 MAG: hypothetical protein A2381_18655 [Bdellovibrionales bacterium RIFOXYB1_FULL_37_110]OFZ65156.1 MAG: hypothetical protein A2577_04970 [Bdellovibrionales bacterium RIFOXYD1_FULL_36_51]
MKKIILATFLLCFGNNLLAIHEGWTSGGGSILKDSNNPWFLFNTKEVRYCILHDPENFSASDELIKTVITQAVEFWKKDFSENVIFDLGQDGYGVATQNFVFEECSDNTDIRFQFGVLNPEQKKYLGDPRDYIAITVRTNYDRINLKGKGFIYLSSDNGPLKYNTKEKIPNPWSQGDGGVLHKVIAHELGHVFGINHTDTTHTGLMRSDYPQYLINHANDFDISINQNIRPFFNYNKINSHPFCDLEKNVREFLNLGPNVKCIGFKHKAYNNEWFLYEVVEGEYTKILATFLSGMNTSSFTSIVGIWVPEEQTLFPKNYSGKTLGANCHSRMTAFGSINSTTSENKTFYFDLDLFADTVIFFRNGHPIFTRHVFSKKN